METRKLRGKNGWKSFHNKRKTVHYSEGRMQWPRFALFLSNKQYSLSQVLLDGSQYRSPAVHRNAIFSAKNGSKEKPSEETLTATYIWNGVGVFLAFAVLADLKIPSCDKTNGWISEWGGVYISLKSVAFTWKVSSPARPRLVNGEILPSTAEPLSCKHQL